MKKSLLTSAVLLSFTLLFTLFSTFSLLAQDGIPYMSNFEGSIGLETANRAMAQDDNNTMVFANKRGLLTFDGYKWQQMLITPSITSLAKEPATGRIFAGTEDDYGYLERNKGGGYNFVSLPGDSAGVGQITKIIVTDTTAIFFSGECISVHNLNNMSVPKRWYSEEGHPFTGYFTHQGKMFFNVEGEGLYRIDSDTLFPLVTGYLTADKEILFSIPYNNDKKLIGTSDSKLKLFDRVMYYDYKMQNPEYLEENILSGATMISDTLVALVTRYGGVVLMEIKTGRQVDIINYRNGLPDDEVYCAGVDNNLGLWISHRYGISRVDFGLPVTSHSHYPGLEGAALSVLKHRNTLYVGTNQGLYYLEQTAEYGNVEVAYRLPSSGSQQTAATEEAVAGDEEKKGGGFLGRLFGGKNAGKDADGTEAAETTGQSPKPATAEPQYGKRTERVLLSVSYRYKKIDGINNGINNIYPAGDGVLAVSNTGIYSVKEFKSVKIDTKAGVNSIAKLDESHYLVCGDEALTVIANDGRKWAETAWSFPLPQPAKNIVKTDQSTFWLGSGNSLYRLKGEVQTANCAIEEFNVPTSYPVDFEAVFAGDTLFALSETGIFIFNPAENGFTAYTGREMVQGIKTEYLVTGSGELLVKTAERWHKFGGGDTAKAIGILPLFDNPGYISVDPDGSMWVVDKNNKIYRVNGTGEAEATDFDMFIGGISGSENSYTIDDELVFKPYETSITINVGAPSYLKEGSTLYKYKIVEMMDNWSVWSSSPDINLFLKPGEYIVQLRAVNVLGEESGIKTVMFTIKKPFTQSIFFFAIIAVAVATLLILTVRMREKKLRNDKQVLEEKVRLRTEEINKQKEYIESQRDEIMVQKEEITSSITYASRIQEAMLPNIQDFPEVLRDSFVLYKPRDIVSGDFYWVAGSDDFVYFTAADCTGHGVPGAFMSMLGISLLNEITDDGKIDLKPSEVLDRLRSKVIMSISHSRKGDMAFDGMDISFCKYNKKKKILEYAGAYNPLYHFRGGELTQYKADRMPVGTYISAAEHFTNHEITIEKGDVVYLFSDGMADQFGGPECKKYGLKNLRVDLGEVVSMPMESQSGLLDKKFEQWRGGQNQVDDVMLIGVRF